MTLTKLSALWRTFATSYDRANHTRWKIRKALQDSFVTESDKKVFTEKMQEAGRKLVEAEMLMHEIVEPHFGRLYRQQVESK